MSLISNGVLGAAMKCLACGAEMRLMDVRTDTTTPLAIERRIFQCSSCRQTAQRLGFDRSGLPDCTAPAMKLPPCHQASSGSLCARRRTGARRRGVDCQSASKFDPRSASNFDPLERRVRAAVLAPSELVGVAETARARVVG